MTYSGTITSQCFVSLMAFQTLLNLIQNNKSTYRLAAADGVLMIETTKMFQIAKVITRSVKL